MFPAQPIREMKRVSAVWIAATSSHDGSISSVSMHRYGRRENTMSYVQSVMCRALCVIDRMLHRVTLHHAT